MVDCLEFENCYYTGMAIFFNNVFQSNGFTYEPEGKHKELTNIVDSYNNKGGGFWVLMENGKIIGSVGLKIINAEKKIGELKCLYILKEYQRKGYGQLLIDRIFQESNLRKLLYIRLDCKRDATNAINLYKKNSFYEIERYNNNPNDVIYMEKQLF